MKLFLTSNFKHITYLSKYLQTQGLDLLQVHKIDGNWYNK